ncbi:MAG: hypothetical protein II377_06380, partial [Clostridia bacterium]|nr:hypothetical protein [Clostridia bacterium]
MAVTFESLLEKLKQNGGYDIAKITKAYEFADRTILQIFMACSNTPRRTGKLHIKGQLLLKMAMIP